MIQLKIIYIGANVFIRHISKGFIAVGDGGVFSGSTAQTSTTIWPAYITAGGGLTTKSYGPSNNRQQVYNSYLYANVIAWAIDYVEENRP